MLHRDPKSSGDGIVWGMLPVVIGVLLITVLLMLLSVPADGLSQETGQAPEGKKIDSAARAEIIDSVTTALNQYYVFPDVAEEMEKYVRKQMKDGKYDTLDYAVPFTEALTQDLREVCHDLHLRVGFAPDEYFEQSVGDTLTDAAREDHLREMAFDNYGFYRVERLNGNIGYLDLRGFTDARWGGETAVAAMKFLANSNAIIIDLRQNGGGSPSMIQLISSYFFDEPVHLNSFYIRSDDTIKQFWTAAHVEGKRMADMDLYILTSSRTFSAAEEFTYNMKNLQRATIIGETTGGGAHPVDGHTFANVNIVMSVPFGRAINPITGTNWEGTGVTPDIEVPQEEALLIARSEALKKVIEEEENQEVVEYLNWDLETIRSELNPVDVEESTLRKYAAIYGPRTITFEDGALYYQREGRPKYRMIPMTDDTFRFDDLEFFRLRIVTDDGGDPVEVRGLYQGGHVDISPKTEG